MRTYTLIFSIVAHVVVACAALFTTVLATDELPNPRASSVFVDVVELPPPPPPPARPPVARVQPPAAVPIEAPVGVHAEVERPPIPDSVEPTPGAVIFAVRTDPGIVLRDEPPPPPPPVERTPLRVGGDIKAPERLVYVTPSYPAMARSARISGIVILEATIAEDGTVRNVRVLRSLPLLDQPALDAVRQWRFTPTLLNGRAVPVLMTVTVAFNLD